MVFFIVCEDTRRTRTCIFVSTSILDAESDVFVTKNTMTKDDASRSLNLMSHNSSYSNLTLILHLPHRVYYCDV